MGYNLSHHAEKVTDTDGLQEWPASAIIQPTKGKGACNG